MPDPVRYVGWRRPPGGTWEQVPGAASDSQLGCMQILERLVFLAVGEEMGTDVFVLPEGQTPGGQRNRQSYLHRSMRPRWGDEP